MTDIAEAFAAAFSLVYHLDSDLGEIVLLSLQVSIGAVAVASVIGLPLGAAWRSSASPAGAPSSSCSTR